VDPLVDRGRGGAVREGRYRPGMQRSRPVAFALLLIGVGVVLLLEQAGAIPEDVSVWPIVLIGAGAFLFVERLVSGGGGGGYVVSMVLVAMMLIVIFVYLRVERYVVGGITSGAVK